MEIKNKKLITLVLLIAAPLIAIYTLRGPMLQDQAYHNFVDDHTLCGISNFHNVFSNILFIIFGSIGIIDYFKNKNHYTLSWLAFFIGVFLVGPGSAWYHLNPNDNTLVWDRIPMTFGFMGLVASIFSDVFKIKNEKPFLTALLILGVYSVMHWVWFEDLRVYAWLQGTTILVMFYMAFAYKESNISMPHLLIAVALYIGAKITESSDAVIYETFGYSGHSIKHLLAAFAVLSLILMKRNETT